jgi:DNA-binding CsgD family transcriptional regulator
MVLTRQERKNLFLDLYNQGRTYREIAEEARMSPRDIGTIVNNAAKEKVMEKAKEYQDTYLADEKKQEELHLTLSTQAYRLFSKGKTPIEVAVILNLGEADVTRYYKEYWRLRQLHGLYLAYEETEGDIEPFLRLYSLSKSEGMSTRHVVNVLRRVNGDLLALENQYNILRNEVNNLELRDVNSNRTLQNLENQIITSTQILDSYNKTCEQERRKIDCLYNEKRGLKKVIRRFKRNNEEYLKIKKQLNKKLLVFY